MSETEMPLLNPKFADYIIGRRPPQGIDAYLDIIITEATAGRLVGGFDVRPELLSPFGTMHGACVSALFDHVLGIVLYPVMPPRYWAATTEFKLNLIAPVRSGRCVATARIVALSKRMAVVQVEVENEGRIVAIGQGTSMIMPPKDRTSEEGDE